MFFQLIPTQAFKCMSIIICFLQWNILGTKIHVSQNFAEFYRCMVSLAGRWVGPTGAGSKGPCECMAAHPWKPTGSCCLSKVECSGNWCHSKLSNSPAGTQKWRFLEILLILASRCSILNYFLRKAPQLQYAYWLLRENIWYLCLDLVIHSFKKYFCCFY